MGSYNRTAIIIGAGPAGLTAAYELLTRTDIRPIVLERSRSVGGISQTVDYKGNRMDLGGHRFFSKSDRVMSWWLAHLPVAKDGDAGRDDCVMLTRSRQSRIYFLRRFFEYPIQLTAATLRNLGLRRTVVIALSYLRSMLFPIRNVTNLEQFFVNRFGRELYSTFFKDYTEKIWGVPCREISAEWGAQRVKGLSIGKAITHVLGRALRREHRDIAQKTTETSLIEQFLYPKLGPGQLWQEVARKITELGGEIITGVDVIKVEAGDKKVVAVEGSHADGSVLRFSGDYFFSTTSVQELVCALGPEVPREVSAIAAGLQYRDFITVGLLLNKLKIRGERPSGLIADNWIYIQEPEVRVGRLQVFNNWSPYLVARPDTVWIGAEYFCYCSDDLWRKTDEQIARLAIEELTKIEMIDASDVLDFTVVRMPKTYPAYFGAYEHFDQIRCYLDSFDNLFLIGRNGMHRYNNQDHSMLTAMTAVDNIVAGRCDKGNIWLVNTEQSYHEENSR